MTEKCFSKDGCAGVEPFHTQSNGGWAHPIPAIDSSNTGVSRHCGKVPIGCSGVAARSLLGCSGWLLWRCDAKVFSMVAEPFRVVAWGGC